MLVISDAGSNELLMIFFDDLVDYLIVESLIGLRIMKM